MALFCGLHWHGSLVPLALYFCKSTLGSREAGTATIEHTMKRLQARN